VVLFLCGDVMVGRGVDQILPHPGDPSLSEPCVRDANEYVRLAEAENGPIPRPVEFAWPWGDALAALDEAEPDARVMNLETSITRCDAYAAEKIIHYRMCPENVAALATARPDVCVLANNHVLDFGRQGLVETLDALAGAGLTAAGAGRDADEARRPAIIPAAGGGRVVVFAFGMPSSGIPRTWAAAADQAGVDVVPEPSRARAAEIVDRVRTAKQPGDVAIASIHWGSNWGYDVGDDQIRFAHWLVDGGIDVVHGHSSHHPRPVEVYRDRLVLYGCGDFIDDYEGISGYESFRDDLRLAYFVSVDADRGALTDLRMVALQARRMRLARASPDDTSWLRGTLDRISLGARFEVAGPGVISLLRPGGGLQA